MNINSRPLAAACAVAALLAASAASAATVARDPVTGELRAPTAAEAQALSQPASGRGAVKAAQANSQARGMLTGRINPQPVHHANGSVEQELDESTLSFSVATRNADGSISQACVSGVDAAEAAMKAPATTSTKTAKKGHSHALK